jgi:hypothetical protein
MRRSNVSTVAIPALVMVIVTGLVPSVATTSARELNNSTMRWRYGNKRGRQLRRPMAPPRRYRSRNESWGHTRWQ